ncbi:MAG: metalloregulator ArsR/SmtB family transcription factor [Formivibrio sp.]|nr:metalloregulator ArsR/SmtB family transcription factor [Formivibrio sp.]
MENKDTVIILAALAQETRLAIYRLLIVQGKDGLAVSRIGEALGVAPATLSFHLKELAHAGLISARQESRFIYYSANYDAMNALIGFLTENCCGGQTCGPAPTCDGACLQ